jgi:hypothetical protein
MKEKFTQFINSTGGRTKTLTTVIVWLGLVIIALVIFLAGESFGYRRAEFSYRFGDSYDRIFDGQQGPKGPLPFPGDNMFTDAHGAYGTVVKVSLPNIIIANNDGVEKTVIVASSSMVKQFRNTVTAQNIAVGDTVTVLGSPNATGDIVATLIRIVPPNANPSNATSSVTSSISQ